MLLEHPCAFSSSQHATYIVLFDLYINTDERTMSFIISEDNSLATGSKAIHVTYTHTDTDLQL